MTTLLAADAISRTSTGEAVTFWVLGTLALIGALGVVMAANAVYCAMSLAMTMLVLAVFYMIEDALFLGVVQIVVYTGAVMMLFLFVLMLIGVDSAESLVETLRGQRRRQRSGSGGTDLLPVPVGVRADQRPADHRSHRRDDPGSPGALRASQDAARDVHRAIPARRLPHPTSRSRCLRPAQRRRHSCTAPRRLSLPVVGARSIGVEAGQRSRHAGQSWLQRF
jgi:hypothetical protein